MDIAGKTVWITGASSGIGEALTYAFAKVGCTLIISSRRAAELERVKAACTGAKAVHLQPLDVAKLDDIEKIAKEVQATIGTIDILVNNAGISQRSLVKDTPLEIDQRIMQINFFGTVALTKAVLPQMLAQKSGMIVNMSSLVGKFGTPLRSAYAASKHALHGFFDSMRAETEKEGVQVLLVCPGFIKTNISVNALNSEGKKQNKMDDAQAGGMLPDELARRILKAIRKNKKEIAVGGKETLAIQIKRFFPALWRRMIANMKVT